MQITNVSPAGELSVTDLINSLNLTAEGTCQRSAWLIDITAARLLMNQDDINWLSNFFTHRPWRSHGVNIAVLTDNFDPQSVINRVVDAMHSLGMRIRTFAADEHLKAEQFLLEAGIFCSD